MISNVRPCPQCGEPAATSFGEDAVGSRLRWFESWSCTACGHTSEADGGDRLPDELRVQSLTATGSYRVRVTPRDAVAFLRALRQTFQMPLAEAQAVYRALPGIFRSGLTRAEASCIVNSLPPDCADARAERET